ncbi:MAG TPA: (Fe-S)-binding protein [Micropepsaceae bacterium]|nr:(Fe-S)-binding protein [Micropepsaceae bacterium]
MTTRVRVGLLVTCLADMFRPEVGFAAVKLLEQAGCDVEVPPQTCCGQPAYNAGDATDAAALARNVIAGFEAFDYVVVPSGSCAGMVRVHYPRLLQDDAAWSARANALAAKTHELFSFLVNVRGLKGVAARCTGQAAYHDSCSSLREMGVSSEPRLLLKSVAGLSVGDFSEKEACCGFGGFFSVKYPEISARMADDKIADAKANGANMILAGDLGCLLHLAGRLSRQGEKMSVRHAAEVLADMGDSPPIGEAR